MTEALVEPSQWSEQTPAAVCVNCAQRCRIRTHDPAHEGSRKMWDESLAQCDEPTPPEQLLRTTCDYLNPDCGSSHDVPHSQLTSLSSSNAAHLTEHPVKDTQSVCWTAQHQRDLTGELQVFPVCVRTGVSPPQTGFIPPAVSGTAWQIPQRVCSVMLVFLTVTQWTLGTMSRVQTVGLSASLCSSLWPCFLCLPPGVEPRCLFHQSFSTFSTRQSLFCHFDNMSDSAHDHTGNLSRHVASYTYFHAAVLWWAVTQLAWSQPTARNNMRQERKHLELVMSSGARVALSYFEFLVWAVSRWLTWGGRGCQMTEWPTGTAAAEGDLRWL